MGDDGCVAIPAGSDYRYRTLGMLSKHPQCDAIRAKIRSAGFGDWPDEPLVIDDYCPLGMIVGSPGWGALFVNHRTPIKRVVILPQVQEIRDIALAMSLRFVEDLE